MHRLPATLIAAAPLVAAQAQEAAPFDATALSRFAELALDCTHCEYGALPTEQWHPAIRYSLF